MKVLFVHGEPELASARVRVLNLVPHLRALGLDCETRQLPPGTGLRRALPLRALLARSDADVVVMQKKTPGRLDALAWRSCRVPLVFDFDDAVSFRHPARNGSWESPARRRRFERAVSHATAFACGNDYLASLCGAAGKPVLIAPSAVPLEVPRARGREAGAPLRVGWIGARHNLHELESLAPTLRALAREIDFELVVISEASLTLPGVRVLHVPWRLDDQEEAVARLDVGLMPLTDSPWSRGKCAYKLLQYMAAGVPGVASRVGMNAKVVRHGENGLLASSPGEFGAAIRELHDDPQRARRLGEAGRATVEQHYAYPVVAASWRSFLHELAGH